MREPLIPPKTQPDPILAPVAGADRTLVFKADPAPAGGLHAILVGVSEYQHLPPPGTAGSARSLGMQQLQSPALSAYRIAQWLVKNAASLKKPLATVRLLLSPSDLEMATEPALKRDADKFVRPTWQAVSAAVTNWRADADHGPDGPNGMTLFLYSGHGVQLTRESTVMLFENFGQPVGGAFNHSTELSNIVAGMNPSQDAVNLPGEQFYFIDACRSQLNTADLLNAEPAIIFDDRPGPDQRSRPVYFATAGGMQAYGNPGEMSFFTRALLIALETGVDQPVFVPGGRVYPITVNSLASRITECLDQDGLPQGCYLGGIHKRAVLRELSQPPDVSFWIELGPPNLIDTTRILLVDHLGALLMQFGPPPPNRPPYKVTVPAGKVCEVRACQPSTAAPRSLVPLFQVTQGLGRVPVIVT